MRLLRPIRAMARVSISIVVAVSMISLLAPVSSASGSCIFCSYSPFSNPVTTNNVIGNLNCGSNNNIAGPTTQNGFKALIEPESKACYDTAKNDYWRLNVSAGFNGISTTALAGAVTAKFYWNLTWDSTVTVAACNPLTYPYGISTLLVYASIYDATSGSYVSQSFLVIFSITEATCGHSTNIHQGTPAPRTITIAFTATSGHNYQFDSRIYGETLADALNVGPTQTNGVDSLLNVASGYNGQFSAIQVY